MMSVLFVNAEERKLGHLLFVVRFSFVHFCLQTVGLTHLGRVFLQLDFSRMLL